MPMAKSTKGKLLLSALFLIFFVLFCCFSGCGGSTSSTTTSTTTPTDLSSLTLSLATYPGGTPTTSVSGDSPTKLTAVARDTDGKPVKDKTVTFTAVTTGLITFGGTPDTGTALTDSSGVATIIIYAAAAVTSGATDINATVTGATANTISGNTGIAVAPANLHLSDLTITPGTGIISPGGTAAVSVIVLDSSTPPQAYLPSVPVSFTSNNVHALKATITAQAYTINGIAYATYTDITGAGSVDTIRATIVGTAITKTGQITVSSTSAGSITFVSATPTNISLKNTGGSVTTQSTVVFQVKDQIGNFMSQLVDFSLDTTAGGITLTGGGTTYSATSDAGNQGYVSTIVYAGTSPTPVRVLATIHGTSPPITSTSIQLVISTGIPTQNNISLAASILNMEAWTVDGVVSVVTARLVDRFQNPVPDGTAVSFWASGGHN